MTRDEGHSRGSHGFSAGEPFVRLVSFYRVALTNFSVMLVKYATLSVRPKMVALYFV